MTTRRAFVLGAAALAARPAWGEEADTILGRGRFLPIGEVVLAQGRLKAGGVKYFGQGVAVVREKAEGSLSAEE